MLEIGTVLQKWSNFDPNKFERQKQSLSTWIGAGRQGTVEAATGFGKTMVGVLAIRNLKKLYGDKHVTVVVPSEYLYNNWNSQLREHQIGNVEVIIINSLLNRERFATTLLVLDEIHRYTAPEFGKVYDRIDYQYIMGLTATIEEDEKYDIIREKCPVIDVIPVQECLENNWVSQFRTYVLGLDIDRKTREKYDEQTKKFNKYFSTFDFDFGRMADCTDKRQAQRFARQIRWDPKTVWLHAINGMKSNKNRNNILYNAEIKVETAEQILRKFTNRKIITFATATEVADRLGTIDGCIAYHSDLPTVIRDKKTGQIVGKKMENKDSKVTFYTLHGIPKKWKDIDSDRYERVSKDRQKPEIIKAFENDQYRAICTAKALDEGTNIENVDMSVTVSGYSSKRQGIQRRGRSIRYVPGKIALDVHLIIKNSQEEKWIKKRLKNLNDIAYVESVDDIV